MESQLVSKKTRRKTRALRVRKGLRGTKQKPRLCVVKTNAHIHVQLLDDEKACTLANTSTLSKENRATDHKRKNKTSAKHLGLHIAGLAKKKKIKKVVFDRGPFKYHGILAAVAEGAREGGLEF